MVDGEPSKQGGIGTSYSTRRPGSPPDGRRRRLSSNLGIIAGGVTSARSGIGGRDAGPRRAGRADRLTAGRLDDPGEDRIGVGDHPWRPDPTRQAVEQVSDRLAPLVLEHVPADEVEFVGCRDEGEFGLENDYEIEATSSPSGVTHMTFTRTGL